MRKLIVSMVICLCLSTTHASAETKVEESVRLSKLTLSAMECANYASDGAEAQRLANIGIAAGRQFLDAFPKLSADEQKAAGPHIALLWKGVSGPSVDFVLGQAWKEMETFAYQSLGDNTKAWDSAKLTKYSQKNCTLIR
jgi:hypothetical protein